MPLVLQPGTMISIGALADFLQHSNPIVDWGATLSILSQVGGLSRPAGAIPATSNPPKPIPTTEVPQPTPTSETSPTLPSQPSPVHPQNEPLDVNPLFTYQDTGTNEERAEEENTKEEGIPDDKGDGEEKNGVETREAEETPVTESTSERLGEVDLNETAKEQGIMTDEEFQSILDQVSREEENAAGMAESLDLASKAVGNESPGKPMVEQMDIPTQSVGERESLTSKQNRRPTDTKTRVTRRKLVMKDDPKAKRLKPSRVSQTVAAKRAGANTTSEAVEISSEEDDEVPSNSGEENPLAAQEEVPSRPTAQEEVPSSLTAQEETSAEEEPIKTQVTESPGQEEPSTEAQRSPDQEMEEERYQLERKRKGKAPAQKKQLAKKARTADTGVVIRDLP